MDNNKKDRPRLPRCEVVGTGFEGREKIIRKHCFETMNVELHRELNNPHDANAVGVWVEASGFFGRKQKKIGYLKKNHAARVAKVLDANYSLWAQIDEIYDPPGRDFPNVRLNLGYN